jgi:cardiolipin synthase A/B
MTGWAVLFQAGFLETWWPAVALAITLLGELLAIIFVIRILLSGGSPSGTLNWIIIILAAPYLGLVLYYLLPRRMQRRLLRQRTKKRTGIAETLSTLTPPPLPGREQDDPLVQLFDGLDPDATHGGNQATLLESGKEFMDHAYAAIEAAGSCVHLEIYILRPDATGKELLERLAAAARRGIEVRILYDSIGSWSLGERHLAGFHAAGGKSAAFLPLLWRRRPFTLNLRNHRKLLIVDGKTAFVGGRNIGDEYARDRFGKSRRWLDSMLRIDGPAVCRLQRIFVEDWYTAAEEVLADPCYFPDQEAAGEQTAIVVEGGPDLYANNLHWMFFQLLTSARSSIRISSPYLVPHPTLFTALRVAATRGIEVKIHTNGPSAEHFLLAWAKRAYYPDLLDAGVRIIETVGDYNHSKLIAVDDRYLFIGSPNLDVRSEELNFEVGALVISNKLNKEAVDLFEKRLKEGKVIDLESIKTNRLGRLWQGLGRLVSPLL